LFKKHEFIENSRSLSNKHEFINKSSKTSFIHSHRLEVLSCTFINVNINYWGSNRRNYSILNDSVTTTIRLDSYSVEIWIRKKGSILEFSVGFKTNNCKLLSNRSRPPPKSLPISHIRSRQLARSYIKWGK